MRAVHTIISYHKYEVFIKFLPRTLYVLYLKIGLGAVTIGWNPALTVDTGMEWNRAVQSSTATSGKDCHTSYRRGKRDWIDHRARSWQI